MLNKVGRFEILSEITHSDLTSVYKASDPESKQTVALKAIRLETLGEQAPTLVKSILGEAEASKVLNSHNIALLYGAGEMDGHLCASMEYVQGNSIATMLARKEGFSIWDLQDVARQSCQGLDHAHVRKVVHFSLEPAKIMVQWDGIVKILSFGVSSMGAYVAQVAGKAPQVLHYMSPEQLRGDPVDARSNLFSLGAILYEMVTERKAFDGEDAEQVRQAILEMTPVAVDQVNPKIHPALSAVIMKALSKAPEERYPSGQDLVNDLEKCKESPTKAAVTAKPAAAKPVAKPMPTAASKVVATPPRVSPTPAPAAKQAPVASAPLSKAAAASAASSPAASSWTAHAGKTPTLDPTAQFITSCVKATIEAASNQTANMSALVTEKPEVEAPKITVDPMMDESRQPGTKGRSFSEIDELPPLKEVYVAPPPPPSVDEPAVVEPVKAATFRTAPPPKPKVAAGEVAKKAVSEIKKTPPRLFGYSIAGAVAVILLVIGGIAYHIYSQDADDDSAPTQPAAAATPAPAPTPQANAAPAQAQPAPAQPPAQVTVEPPAAEPAAVSVTPKYSSKASRKKKAPTPAAPAIVAGQLSLDSTPPGAQIQIDGQSAGAVTPFNLAGLVPGQHTVTISKPGYAAETRAINVPSGGKSVMSVQLAPLTATVSVSSDPTGAAVWIDGKDTGRATPAQIPLDKPGNHTFVFKRQGYLDETTTANVQIGQTSHLSATLRELGNTDEIKMGGGKFKKLLGSSGTAGMGAVSVKTQPKGAQIAVNNRLLDKLSPVEFHLNPGNYVIDITMSGFKSIHKVITVEKNGKVSIDENMDRD